MKKDYSAAPIGKAILIGLIAGMSATLVCLGFDIFYRLETWYGPSDFINVSSIIFIVNLLLMVAGLIYFAFKSWFRKADLIFTAFFGLLTVFCIWKAIGIQRFSDHLMNHEFIFLLCGTLGIIGFFALCIPPIFHSKKILDLFYEADV